MTVIMVLRGLLGSGRSTNQAYVSRFYKVLVLSRVLMLCGADRLFLDFETDTGD